ncbi:MAG: HAD-IC family P-type ATPase, partial [Clostridia bacterium]|nr:HAD-IC family P-type ATPase [Clostridia bacterium]
MQRFSNCIAAEREFIHSIPGRIRIRIEALRNNTVLCNRIIKHLSSVSGVVMATANIYTAKLLVLYNPNQISSTDIDEELNNILLGTDKREKKDNAAAAPGKLIHADFRQKRVLPCSEFAESRNALSNEYRSFNMEVLKKMPLWHTISPEEIAGKLESHTKNGLPAKEAENRLYEFGHNEFDKHKEKSLVSMFFRQFDGFIVKLLLAASGVSFLLGQVADAVSILLIMGLEAVLGVWQEHKAEKSLHALKQLSSPSAVVIREGKRFEVSSSKVVPGDIILLEAGNIVPADARLIESCGLEIVEASLTGEAFPATKEAAAAVSRDALPGDRINMAYMGTSVVRGTGRGIVVNTGMNTEIGKIANLISQDREEKTPLQKDLDYLAKIISAGCLGICAVITLGGVLGGHPLLEMLSTGVSLAVGAIPEGLTTVLTISLAFVAQRMAKKKAVVKAMPAVETLSCTKVICTDKTGTLTRNEMTVREIFTMDKLIHVSGEGYNLNGSFSMDGQSIKPSVYEDLKLLLTAGVLCNNSALTKASNGSYEIKGDPTEAALLVCAEKAGISMDSFKCYKREHEIPFDSKYKKMTAVCKDEKGEYYVFCKGAVDSIIDKCTRIHTGERIEEMNQEHREKILQANDNMAAKALRVISLAYKPKGSSPVSVDEKDIEEDLIFIGLAGMIDPPRPEVRNAIEKCRKAGIKVVMITGDHKKTAEAVAADIGILMPGGLVVSGTEVECMDDGQLSEIIDKVQVFARTCPQQKLKIVRAFKQKGYIVAMTGDGINDAPALKEAHIGIAMGRSGTDVTKEASSIVLMDDNFNTIVRAVEEGRTINRNIKKFMKYVLSGNFAEVLAIFLASVSGFPTPL